MGNKVVLNVSIDRELFERAQMMGMYGAYSAVLEEALRVLLERLGEDFLLLSRKQKRERIRDVLACKGQNNIRSEKPEKEKPEPFFEDTKESKNSILEQYQGLW